MNENKYYTPTIDEFHVGFEYIISDFYVKDKHEILDVMDDYGYPERDELSHINAWINNCRVKYLDKEDIESFGFIKNDLNMQQIYTDFFNMNKDCVKNKCPYRLYIDYDSHLIMIKYPLSDGQILFNGTIKNKSELKTLLKQLGIYNERK